MKSNDGRQKVSGSKCRRRSSFVWGSVGGPDTICKDRILTKQTSSVFNQLPPSRLERVFGRRTALFPGVEGEEPNPASEICVLGFWDWKYGKHKRSQNSWKNGNTFKRRKKMIRPRMFVLAILGAMFLSASAAMAQESNSEGQNEVSVQGNCSRSRPVS